MFHHPKTFSMPYDLGRGGGGAAIIEGKLYYVIFQTCKALTLTDLSGPQGDLIHLRLRLMGQYSVVGILQIVLIGIR